MRVVQFGLYRQVPRGWIPSGSPGRLKQHEGNSWGKETIVLESAG